MTAKARRRKNTLLPFTNGHFSQTFDRQWAGFLRGIGCHRVPGFIPPIARFIHNNIKGSLPSVCTALSVRLQSYMSCLVPSSHLSYAVYTVVQVTFIHSCIQAFTHQYFHILAHASVHNTHIHTRINSHMVASVAQSLVWSYLINSVINRSKWQVLHNGQLEVYLSFF